MRKVAIATVATGVAALGVAAIAEAAATVSQSYKAQIIGKAGTKAKPHSVEFKTTISAHGAAPTPDGNWANSHTVLKFDKNIKFHPEAFPTCSESQVLASASACKKALVGTGQVNSTVGQQGTIKVAPTVTYYNGPGRTLVIILTKGAADQVDSSATLIGKLNPAGNQLDVPIPAKLQSQLGLPISLTLFTAKIKKTATVKGKTVGYVESVGCTGGHYTNTGTFTYVTFPGQGGTPAPPVPDPQKVVSKTSC